MTQETHKDSTFQQVYKRASSWLMNAIGLIALVIGLLVVFFVSAVEGTKEIKASNSDNGRLMVMWEEQYPDESPEPKVSVVNYRNRDYYYMEVYNKDGLIDWYWAYDGGFGYVFKDAKFYILTSVASVIAIIVANMNYVTTTRSAMNTSDFKASVGYYRDQKNKISGSTHYIPNFCLYKNTQIYNQAVRDIVEEAGIPWNKYNKIDKTKLEKWQIKKLKKINKIKIIRLYSSDLLQEKGSLTNKIRLLPMGQDEHRKKYTLTMVVQKIISFGLAGLTAAFGLVLDNWVLGLTYSALVLFSYAGAVITANDYVLNILRNRFIAKGDYLNEFYNMIDKFIKEEEDALSRRRENYSESTEDVSTETEPLQPDASGDTEISTTTSADFETEPTTTVGGTQVDPEDAT